MILADELTDLSLTMMDLSPSERGALFSQVMEKAELYWDEVLDDETYRKVISVYARLYSYAIFDTECVNRSAIAA